MSKTLMLVLIVIASVNYWAINQIFFQSGEWEPNYGSVMYNRLCVTKRDGVCTSIIVNMDCSVKVLTRSKHRRIVTMKQFNNSTEIKNWLFKFNDNSKNLIHDHKPIILENSFKLLDKQRCISLTAK